MKYKRIILIVLDSLGVGEAKDADKFHDEGASTLGTICHKTNIKFTNLEKMGLINLVTDEKNKTISYYTYAEPISNGKDTLTGHLEMMGIHTVKPFKTFTETGFPKELVDALEKESGHKFIGNYDASGTEIIKELGEEHMDTGALILYTSADSVLQIAAHEDIIPIEELYRVCKIARQLTLKEEWKVGRIIARPFIGIPGNFIRTPNRHDYALDPVSDTVLDNLKNNDFDVIAIGKITDIFNNCGITVSNKTKDNLDGINKIVDTINKDFNGLCFANLNDFDSKYGHRRNILGYAECLLEFDKNLPRIIANLKKDDLLIITADHGNDPGYHGTDHTRENVPVIAYSKNIVDPKKLEYLHTFADIGATIADNFNVKMPNIGTSFLDKLK
ncbi:MAG: phosphopentomutase [Ignavibacteriales bacterium]